MREGKESRDKGWVFSMEKSLITLLSKSLGIPSSSILNYAGLPKMSRSYYAIAKIPKKHPQNGFRTVYLPCAELKIIQRFLVDWFFCKLPVHASAKAYRKGLNVCSNASAHLGNRHFLMLDIHDFFQSMDIHYFHELLMSNEVFLSKEDADLAIRLCSYNGTFVQGCVSSPSIANAYLYSFDVTMETLVRSLPGGTYTRYSDDITISSKERIPNSFVEKVASELQRYHLSLNEKKTRFCSNLERLKITGIRIKNSMRIGLDTAFKKQLKKEIYQYLNPERCKERNVKTREELMGKLAYLKMVDPSYYNLIISKYQIAGRSIYTILKEHKRNNSKKTIPNVVDN